MAGWFTAPQIRAGGLPHEILPPVYLTIKETFRLRAPQTNCEMIATRKDESSLLYVRTFSLATRVSSLEISDVYIRKEN